MRGWGVQPKANDRPTRGAEPTLNLLADRAPPFRLRLKAVSTLMPIWGPARPSRRIAYPSSSLFPLGLPQAPPILTSILPRPASPGPTCFILPRAHLEPSPQAPAPPLASEKLGCPLGLWQQTWWVTACGRGSASAQVSCRGGARGPERSRRLGGGLPARDGAGPAGPPAWLLTGEWRVGRIHNGGREGTIWT